MKFLKSILHILAFSVLVIYGFKYDHMLDIGLIGLGFSFGFIYVMFIGRK